MSEGWLLEGERVLDILRRLDMEGKDRLDLTKYIRFALYELNRSVSGWLLWINNPDMMVNFSIEEFQEINKTILELTKTFIEYDLKITKLGIEKGLKQAAPVPTEEAEDEYIV